MKKVLIGFCILLSIQGKSQINIAGRTTKFWYSPSQKRIQDQDKSFCGETKYFKGVPYTQMGDSCWSKDGILLGEGWEKDISTESDPNFGIHNLQHEFELRFKLDSLNNLLEKLSKKPEEKGIKS